MNELVGKQLNLDYMNYSNFNEIQLSANNLDNNVIDLQAKVINGKLNIQWTDCSNTFWEENILVKTEGTIPTTPYAGQIIYQSSERNKYTTSPLIDEDIKENVLYCYRIFTKLSNEPEPYSGLKNIFFVYAYNINFDFSVITAEMILVDSQHRFVTDNQIETWTNMSNNLITYTKTEIDTLISNNSISASERTKLDMIDTAGQDKFTVSQTQIDNWNAKQSTSNKNQPNGYVGLDSASKIDPQYIPIINPWIAKGSGSFNGTIGTTINIPLQLNVNYIVNIQPSGDILNNPNGYLGEVYVQKGLNNIIVKNTGSAKTTFDYIII